MRFPFIRRGGPAPTEGDQDQPKQDQPEQAPRKAEPADRGPDWRASLSLDANPDDVDALWEQEQEDIRAGRRQPDPVPDRSAEAAALDASDLEEGFIDRAMKDDALADDASPSDDAPEPPEGMPQGLADYLDSFGQEEAGAEAPEHDPQDTPAAAPPALEDDPIVGMQAFAEQEIDADAADRDDDGDDADLAAGEPAGPSLRWTTAQPAAAAGADEDDDAAGEGGVAAPPLEEQTRMVEAMLFASDAPLSTAELGARMPIGSDPAVAVRRLEQSYQSRGVRLVRVAGKWAFRTAPDLAYMMTAEQVETRKLSKAAIETLAIVAYHQPVTRAEIEEIRQVSVSKGTIDLLMELEWIKLGRRRQTPGRPVTFITTEKFLDHFGLETTKDLPGLDELRQAGLLDNRPAIGLSPEGGEPLEVELDEDEEEDDGRNLLV